MRTLLKLEDALDDTPQTRTLLHLIEDDAAHLRRNVSLVESAARRILKAQNELAASMSNMSTVLAVYGEQRFALEQSDLDTGSVLNRLHNVTADVAQWTAMVAEQMDGTMMTPLTRLRTDLDATLGPFSDAFHDCDASLIESRQKLARTSKNDTPRLQSNSQNVANATKSFHKSALAYYSRLNSIQFTRYTHVLEPLLAFIYAQKTCFSSGAHTLNEKSVGEFLMNTQQQIQSIHLERSKIREESAQYASVVDDMIATDDAVYHSDAQDGGGTPTNEHTTCGYVYIKSKTSLLPSWDRRYIYWQGSQLICQGADDIAGHQLIDVTDGVTVATVNDRMDRRFTFDVVTTKLPRSDGKKSITTLQAQNSADRQRWVKCINSVAKQNHNEAPPISADSIQLTPGIEREEVPKAEILFYLPNEETKKVDDDDALTFRVRFLGCTPVKFPTGGALITDSISSVMSARAAKEMFCVNEMEFVIHAAHVILRGCDKDSPQSVTFGLETISDWIAHPTNEHMFGIIVAGDTQNTCYAFEMDDEATAMCDVLRQRTTEAFERLTKEEGEEEGKGDRDDVIVDG